MASSSSHKQDQELNAFSGIEPAGIRRKVCESSRLFDVFINHRGPDVKQTLATQLYNSLERLGIRVFLDSEEKELGNLFSSTIEAAIRSSKVHIAIFSRRYAESPWCLAELDLMLQSKAKIIPVFYEVKPSDLRRIKKGAYGDAFVKYKKKGRYLEKLNKWKGALHSLSYIAGEEFSSFSVGQCEKIVEAVQEEVQRKTCLHVADYPVGLYSLMEDFERHFPDELVEDIENKGGLKNGRDKVKMGNYVKSSFLFDVQEADVGSRLLSLKRQLFEDPFEKVVEGKRGPGEGERKSKIVGIFGMGGAGKTTLAKELFNRKNLNYKRTSFLFDVREKSMTSQLHSLQLKLLKDLFKDGHLNFTSTEEGTSYLKDRLRRSHQRRSHHSSFLIVVDNIDHVEQLNALAVMDIVNNLSGSLVIITTRDEGVLIAAGISDRYCLKGMNKNDGRELFCWNAFNQSHPPSNYEELVDSSVDLCAGLPLSLQILGRHVRDRTQDYWRLELIKVRKMLQRDVKRSLRISFESLDDDEKQVFMDIACFFVGKARAVAERILDGSGWNAHNAIEKLKDKCLLEIEEVSTCQGLVLRMHDHLRDLGREMANELSPPFRLWRPDDLKSLESKDFKTVLAKTNIRCFHSIFDESMGSQVTFFLGQANNWFEDSGSLLWLELEEQPRVLSWIPLLNFTEQRSIPTWIPLQNLQCLKIKGGRLRTLWKNCVQEPSELKELEMSCTSLKEFPDFVENVLFLENGGNCSGVKAPMSGLEKLEISGENYVSNILISGIHYPRLKSIKLHGMKNLMEVNLTKVKTLKCLDMENCKKLKKLTVRRMKCLESIKFDTNEVLQYFELDDCKNLKTLELDWNKLVELSIGRCPELPAFIGPCRIERIIIDGKFECLELNGCRLLRSVIGNLEVSRLYVRDCPQLETLSSLSKVSCLEGIVIDSCENLGRISGIEELHVSKYMRLCYCSNAVIRNCIHELKSMPSEYTLLIGKAADGAESRLNEDLFCDFNIGVDGAIEIGTHETVEWSELSTAAVIVCFLVVVDSSTSVEDINQALQRYIYGYVHHQEYSINVREGEWIITMVAWNDWSYFNIMDIEDLLLGKGIMMEGFRVRLKKGEEWKGVGVLRTIVNKLYDL